jgi:hypothetical protein
MEALVLEANAQEAYDFAGILWSGSQTDTRWVATRFVEFNPTASLNANADEIEWVIPEQATNNFIMLNNLILSIWVKITKGDGETPPVPGSQVAPQNDVLYSMFSELTIKLNDIDISTTYKNTIFVPL